MDAIQKLHVSTHKLDIDPRRLTYHATSSTVVVVGEQSTLENGVESSKGVVRFFDFPYCKEIHSFWLDPFEEAISVESLNLALPDFTAGGAEQKSVAMDLESEEDKDKGQSSAFPMESLIVVGTVYIAADSSDTDHGRILIFRIGGNTGGRSGGRELDGGRRSNVSLLSCTDINGPVYSLSSLKGHGKLVAAIDNRISVFDLQMAAAPAMDSVESVSSLPRTPGGSSSTNGPIAPPAAPEIRVSSVNVAESTPYMLSENCRLSSNAKCCTARQRATSSCLEIFFALCLYTSLHLLRSQKTMAVQTKLRRVVQRQSRRSWKALFSYAYKGGLGHTERWEGGEFRGKLSSY